jgi:hypothetical protein
LTAAFIKGKEKVSLYFSRNYIIYRKKMAWGAQKNLKTTMGIFRIIKVLTEITNEIYILSGPENTIYIMM